MPRPQNGNNTSTREATRTKELIQQELNTLSQTFTTEINTINRQIRNMDNITMAIQKFYPNRDDAKLWLQTYDAYADSHEFNDAKYIATFKQLLDTEGQQWVTKAQTNSSSQNYSY